MTNPPTKTQTLRALRKAAEHIEQASNALLPMDAKQVDGLHRTIYESIERRRLRWLDDAKYLAMYYGEIERGEQG